MKSSVVFLAAFNVACTFAMSPEFLEAPNCNSCQAAAAPGQQLTFDPTCLQEGGLGCVSSGLPEQTPEFRGCRYCEFGPFEEVPCETTVCSQQAPLRGQYEQQYLIQETCETCQATAGFLDSGEMETLTYDEACLHDHADDRHGGLGCIAISAPNDPNPKFSGCRYCGFRQYAAVSCATSMCAAPPQQFLRGGETCNTCRSRAGVGERVTFDESCLTDGGLGCVSVSPPGHRSMFNGCRHCEYSHFASVPCRQCSTSQQQQEYSSNQYSQEIEQQASGQSEKAWEQTDY